MTSGDESTDHGGEGNEEEAQDTTRSTNPFIEYMEDVTHTHPHTEETFFETGVHDRGLEHPKEDTDESTGA